MPIKVIAAALPAASSLIKPVLPKRPYRREESLDRLEIFQPHETLDILTLRKLLGERDAIRIVLRVRRKLKRALQSQRNYGIERSYLYDLNRHMNLAYCLAEETKLAHSLIAAFLGARRAAA